MRMGRVLFVYYTSISARYFNLGPLSASHYHEFNNGCIHFGLGSRPQWEGRQ